MHRVWGLLLLASMLGVLLGCGGGGGSAALPGGGQTVRVGNLEVQTEASANFKTLALQGAPGATVAMTVLHGSTITRLSELRRIQKLAFASGRDGDLEIYTMFTDGGGLRKLTNNVFSDTAPSWSPDGSKIAFVSNRDGNQEIYTMNADGTSQTRLTNDAGVDTAPAWCPDGSLIAFQSNRASGNVDIYTMNPDGTNQTRLTTNAAADAWPCWSPGGSQIAFSRFVDTGEQLFTMASDGSSQTVLFGESTGNRYASWSPDGSKIAFESSRTGHPQVHQVTFGDGSVRQLTESISDDSWPCWSPDGSKLVTTRSRGGKSALNFVIADGTSNTIAFEESAELVRPMYTPVLSPPEVFRTFIGTSGTDGGSNPPFGNSRFMAVVGVGPEGVVSAATLALPGSGSAVVPEAVNYGGSALPTLKLTGSPVFGVVEDQGRGKPTLFWDTDITGMSSGALLVFFSGTTGRVSTIIASVDTASTAGSAASPIAQTAGGQITLRGAFAAAYDADDRDGNRVSGTASKIVLEESTGRILSVQ